MVEHRSAKRAPKVSIGKRELAARWAEGAGLTAALGLLPQRDQLLVLNYHRIGEPDRTPFHRGVFSATVAEFDAQLSFLRDHFEMVNLDRALAFVEGRPEWRGTGVLITFDDGYRDNHELALPILQAHGVTAVFFLATGFVSTNRVPWWDEIAYLVRRCGRASFPLRYPEPQTIVLEGGDREPVIRRLFGLYNEPRVEDKGRFLSELRVALEVGPCEADPPLFMNWSEAADLVARGMEVGSHTHTHPDLESLAEASQVEELAESRQILEDKLRVEVRALAYPGDYVFSATTLKAVAQCGYRAAFSFQGGFNRFGAVDRYDIQRQAVGVGTSMARFRLRLFLGAASARIAF